MSQVASTGDRYGNDLDYDTPNGGWKAYMDIIQNNGGDIIVVDDQDGAFYKYWTGQNTHTAAWGYAPPEGASGDFVYIVSRTKHFADPKHPWPFSGTNTNTRLRDFVYGLIVEMSQ